MIARIYQMPRLRNQWLLFRAQRKVSPKRKREKKIDNNHSNFTIAIFILNIPFYFTHLYLRISLAHLLFRRFLLVVQNIPTWSLWLTRLSHKPSIVNSLHSGIKISLYLVFLAMWLAIIGFL